MSEDRVNLPGTGGNTLKRFQSVHGNYSQYSRNYSGINATRAFWVNHFREPFQTFTTSGLSEPGLDKLRHHMCPKTHKLHLTQTTLSYVVLICPNVEMLSLSFRWATMTDG